MKRVRKVKKPDQIYTESFIHRTPPLNSIEVMIEDNECI